MDVLLLALTLIKRSSQCMELTFGSMLGSGGPHRPCALALESRLRRRERFVLSSGPTPYIHPLPFLLSVLSVLLNPADRVLEAVMTAKRSADFAAQ